MDPNTTPALAPPAGVKSQLRDSYAITGSEITLATVCLSFCAIAIAARTYTRVFILKTVEVADGFLILSGLLFGAFTAVKLVADTYGQGHHQWDISITNLGNVLRMANFLEILYGPTMFTAKYVVLKQIEDIFYRHRRQTLASKVIWGLIGANLIFYAALFFAFIFACVPRDKIANPLLPGRCIDTNASIIATSAINVVSDLTILLIPLAAVSHLQLPARTKIGVAGVFAVGVFATSASIIRLVYSVILTQTEDATQSIELVGSWALAEFTTVILVACFPVFPRLFRHLRGQNREVSYPLSDGVPSKGRSSNKDFVRQAHSLPSDQESLSALRGPDTKGGWHQSTGVMN